VTVVVWDGNHEDWAVLVADEAMRDRRIGQRGERAPQALASRADNDHQSVLCGGSTREHGTRLAPTGFEVLRGGPRRRRATQRATTSWNRLPAASAAPRAWGGARFSWRL
jgi:hypothetical protein